jgi:acyl carrier protein
MSTMDDVKIVLRDTLQLGDRIDGFDASTPLFGSLPEFDSMAVVSVITALEERFDFVVDDDEITAKVFETVGTLSGFVDQKLQP